MCVRRQFDRSTLDANTRRINLIFGGKNPNVKNILYTHGEIDPWSVTGILETLSPDAEVMIIPEAAHCYDIFKGNDNDRGIQAARNRVKELVKKWIQ